MRITELDEGVLIRFPRWFGEENLQSATDKMLADGWSLSKLAGKTLDVQREGRFVRVRVVGGDQ